MSVEGESVLRQCLESVSILHVSIVPWTGHTTPMWSLDKEESEKKNQRAIGLPQLVSLASVKEDLGNMDRLQSITYAHAYCWNPGDGRLSDSVFWSHSFCRQKQ